MPKIKLITDPEEKEAVYRFRYKVYIEEMNRKQLYANHKQKRIEGPLDKNCFLLAGVKDGKIVGTVRINYSALSDIGYYEDFFKMKDFIGIHPKHTSMCTGLMVAPEFRKGTLAARLAIACYEKGLQDGIKINFVDCNDPVHDFFIFLGYKPYSEKMIHEEYGEVNVMVLDLFDKEHLKKVKSPFLRSLQAFNGFAKTK